MASGAESIEPLAGRLRRVGEMLIGLSGSPVPTVEPPAAPIAVEPPAGSAG